MSYTIQNDWQRKDALGASAAGKVISGTHFFNEFVAIQSEFDKKSNVSGDINQSFNTRTEAKTDNTNKSATTEYVTRAITDASEGFVKYPVGSIFTTTIDYATSTDVVDEIGGTTWTPFGEGKVLVGVDPADTTDEDFDIVGKEGGAKTHTLTEDEMPSHRHSEGIPRDSNGTDDNYALYSTAGSDESILFEHDTGYTGGVGATDTTAGVTSAHNNLQPYITVYMWKRTA